MLEPAVVKAPYYCDAIMTPCLCKVVMFSQITRCTVDFWHDTSFSHLPFLWHLHSLTIAAGAHFPPKWFAFCLFSEVQLAGAKKKKKAWCEAAWLRLHHGSCTGLAWGVTGICARCCIAIPFHADLFSSCIQRYRCGNDCGVSLFPIDFGADSESEHGLWEEVWSSWSEQGAGLHPSLCSLL